MIRTAQSLNITMTPTMTSMQHATIHVLTKVLVTKNYDSNNMQEYTTL